MEIKSQLNKGTEVILVKNLEDNNVAVGGWNAGLWNNNFTSWKSPK
jgi:hypothetical protein